jgi:hypothetical protein
MMSHFKRTADEARRLLEKIASAPHPEDVPQFAVAFLRSAAILADDLHRAELATVIEFLDVREKVSLSPAEVAHLVSRLTSLDILRFEGSDLVFTEVGWNDMPRTRDRKLAVSRKANRRWLSIVAKPRVA